MTKIPRASKDDYPTLDKHKRRYIGVMRERRAFLETRLFADPDAPVASYYQAEVNALTWALDLVQAQYSPKAIENAVENTRKYLNTQKAARAVMTFRDSGGLMFESALDILGRELLNPLGKSFSAPTLPAGVEPPGGSSASVVGSRSRSLTGPGSVSAAPTPADLSWDKGCG